MPLKIGSLEKESTVYEEGLYIMGMGPFLGVLVVPVLPKRARLDHVVLTVPSPPPKPMLHGVAFNASQADLA